MSKDTKGKKRKRLDPWKHCVAGVSAGGVATFALHPLDLVKTRFQVYDRATKTTSTSSKTEVVPGYRSVFNAFRSIVKEEGVKSLYQGVNAAMFGSAVSWGLYFFFYENAKRRYANLFSSSSSEEQNHLPVLQQLASATEAGVTTVLITNPIWLVKTRLQIQINNLSAKSNTAQSVVSRPYRGVLDTFSTIVKEEGPLGLYRGVSAALILTSHGTIQFFAYEYIKEFLQNRREMGRLDPLWMGAAAKLVASTATYPYQLIKARIQQRQIGVQYDGIIDCARKIISREGYRGFYKGIAVNTIRVVPSSALIFFVYESVARVFKNEEDAT